jgi:hypothetical protein
MLVKSANLKPDATAAPPALLPPKQAQPRSWQSLIEFCAISVQLVLLGILIWRFNLESPAFLQLCVFAFAGFAINYFLPLNYRLSFFVILSLAGIFLVLGTEAAAWTIGVGLALIGICHLPAPFWTRVLLLAGTACLLAAMRGGWIVAPLPFAIWPILGSMFMFRLAVYMYDMRHGIAPMSPMRSLSYFFMLPNVCFPLFPVVDYQSFCRDYYNDEQHRIYQVGVRWIFRGVLHLLLYRILYKNYGISLYDVENAGDLAHYCLWLFLLYLRVSGQFHIIIGIMRLYGFNLPETHKLYYLSSSFTDFWRRINIYWKDFMMKLFFYPSFFRLRGRGPMAALIVSTLAVFFLTWLLHAVQWFWLRGTFLLTATDALFWAILAGLVVANSLWEQKHGRQRAIALGTISWPKAIGIGLKTLATFTVICVLWSLWNSESLSEWLTVWRYAIVPPTANGWLLIAGVAAILVTSAAFLAHNPSGFRWSRLTVIQEAAVRCVIMIVMASLSLSAVYQRLGSASKLILAARSSGLNREDEADVERGYYEGLLAVDKFNLELFDHYARRPPEWGATITDVGLATPTHDFQRYELKPSAAVRFKGAVLHTNRWGMHDKDYSLEPPPKTFRVALLGASHAMGTGVDREGTFEAILERRLNEENDGGTYQSIEILNFAVWGYRPVQQIEVLNEKVLPFRPNAMLYVEHPGDNRRLIVNLGEAVREGIELPYPYLRQLVAKAGIDRTTPLPKMRRRLEPYVDDIVLWLYRDLVRTCKDHEILPVYVSLPVVHSEHEPPNLQPAREAGFTIIDLKGVYAGHTWYKLILSQWDSHPNAEGHRIVAERLYREIHDRGIIPLRARDQTGVNRVKSVPLNTN